MPDSDDRIENLEQKVRTLQAGMLVLAVSLIAVFVLGATNKTPDELTLRRLAIVDGDGKQRIIATTLSDGTAALYHLDSDGKQRIMAMTFPDGSATLVHNDRDGKQRIAAGTASNGMARISHFDREEKLRIITATMLPTGTTGVWHYDSKGKIVWEKTSK